MPPLLLSGTRFVVAGSVLFVWMYLRRRASGQQVQPLSFVHWRSALIVGGSLLFFGNGSVSLALLTISSSITALLIATTPFWMLFFGRMLSQEPIAIKDWFGVALGFSGVALLMAHRVGPDALHPMGACLGLFAAAAWAFGSAYSRKLPLPKETLLAASMEMMWGGALLIVLALVRGEHRSLPPFDITVLGAIWAWLYLIVFGSWIAFSAYAFLLKTAPLPLVSSYAYVNPVVAMILGAVWLDEPVTLRTLAAAAMILVAVAITAMRRK